MQKRNRIFFLCFCPRSGGRSKGNGDSVGIHRPFPISASRAKLSSFWAPFYTKECLFTTRQTQHVLVEWKQLECPYMNFQVLSRVWNNEVFQKQMADTHFFYEIFIAKKSGRMANHTNFLRSTYPQNSVWLIVAKVTEPPPAPVPCGQQDTHEIGLERNIAKQSEDSQEMKLNLNYFSFTLFWNRTHFKHVFTSPPQQNFRRHSLFATDPFARLWWFSACIHDEGSPVRFPFLFRRRPPDPDPPHGSLLTHPNYTLT